MRYESLPRGIDIRDAFVEMFLEENVHDPPWLIRTREDFMVNMFENAA